MRDRKRGTVRDLRRENRAAVLWSLYLGQSGSRHELSAATGLSAASVTNVIRELIDEGVVIETDRAIERRPRRALMGKGGARLRGDNGVSSPPRIVGVTGPPGAGKSTTVGALVSAYRERDMRVAVLAVDPSSPYSGIPAACRAPTPWRWAWCSRSSRSC